MRPAADRASARILSRRGSTLVVALITVMVIAMVSGHILLRITGQMETAQRSAAWNEALSTAEAAVDITIADLTAALPSIKLNSPDGLFVDRTQFPNALLTSLGIGSNSLSLQQGVTVSYTPTTLKHADEEFSRQETIVFLDVVPLSQLLGSGELQLDSANTLLTNPLAAIQGGDLQLVRLRARGTVGVPSRRADRNALDSELRRATLVWDRTSGQFAPRAAISREVEVYLKPVFPFESAVTCTGSFDSPSASAVFDSFNSLLTTASTSGLYDITKRLSNGDVNVYNSQLDLAGTVYGDVHTSGADLVKSDRITGEVDNSSQEPLPFLHAPTWQKTPLSPTEIIGNTTLSAGGALPARYKLDRITAPLRIARNPLTPPGLAADVEIWITGDVTGSITLDPGVSAKIYLEGNMSLPAGGLVNGSQRARNLQIYGLPADTSGGTREIRLALGEVCAAVYAPTHNVRLTGDGHFQGAITSANFVTEGAAHIHFDEGLAFNIGPMIRFQVASWVERRL